MRLQNSVIVLEEIQPVNRWLLYFRPRKDHSRWLLFFNDAVTYANEREVFEDNFREDYDVSVILLRTPYVLVYARVNRIDEVLG